MRLAGAILIAAVSAAFAPACFIPADGDDIPEPPILDCGTYATCYQGTLYTSDPGRATQCPLPFEIGPNHGVGFCAEGCAGSWGYGPTPCNETAPCTAAQAAAQCWDDAPPEQTCAIAGTACPTVDETSSCDAALACADALEVGTCTCGADGVWACAPACLDGLCSADEVQEAMSGGWMGTVTPPPSVGAPYGIGLVDIERQGLYTGASGDYHLFWYGISVDADAHRHIDVIAQTAEGGYATVTVDFGATYEVGTLRNIRRNGNRLLFTFVPAWLGCDLEFQYDLVLR